MQIYKALQAKSVFFKSLFSLFLIVFQFTLLISPVNVFAQDTQSPVTIPGAQYSGPEQTIRQFFCTPTEPTEGNTLLNLDGASASQVNNAQDDLYNCIQKLYRFAFVAAGVTALFMIIYAGYLYMYDNGSGNQKKEAKKKIFNVVIGIILLGSTYMFLRFINPELLVFRTFQVSTLVRNGNPDSVFSGNNDASSVRDPVSGVDVKTCGSAIKDIPIDIAGKSGEKACPDLILALKEVKDKGGKFIVTDAYGQGHDSICHKIGGTCADLVPTGGMNWDELCAAIKSTGKFRILNESKKSSVNCGQHVQTSKTTGAHLHIILQSANDNLLNDKPAGGSTIIGVSDYSGPERWPDADWTNTKPELRTAFNKFNEVWISNGNKALQLRQVYRSDAYAKYIRSLWEYDQLLQNKNPLVDLYGCEGFRHITKADLDKLTSEELKVVKEKISIHGNKKGPACSSDHGKGIAFDITPPESGKISAWIDTALSVGLCHHIKNDLPHFALKSYLPNGTNCKVID